jgi:hypothetical protein
LCGEGFFELTERLRTHAMQLGDVLFAGFASRSRDVYPAATKARWAGADILGRSDFAKSFIVLKSYPERTRRKVSITIA